MVRNSVKLALSLAWGILALAPPCAAKSQDLYPGFGDFALRAPDALQGAKPDHLYAQTGPNPGWVISQWNIAGPALSTFTVSQQGGQTIYTASAPAASVRITKTAAGSDVTLQQNGAAVPCKMAGGAPWESDLFLTSKVHAAGSVPGQPSAYVLSNIVSLHEIVTLSVTATPSTPAKSCAATVGGSVLAIVLQDFATKPYQVFYYQLHPSGYCPKQPGGMCSTPWPRPVYYTNRNPYGCDDILSRLGQPLLHNGTPRALDVDVLPGLREAVAGAPGGMDHDLSHWHLNGAYIGLISWGDVDLTSHWHGYHLVVESN
jgi:hypothetical protein